MKRKREGDGIRAIGDGGMDPLLRQEKQKLMGTTFVSAKGFGGQFPTGVGTSLVLLAIVLGSGQNWPPYARRSNVAKQVTPAESVIRCRRQVQHQTELHIPRAKGGGSTTRTSLITPFPHANSSPYAKQYIAQPDFRFAEAVHSNRFHLGHSHACC